MKNGDNTPTTGELLGILSGMADDMDRPVRNGGSRTIHFRWACAFVVLATLSAIGMSHQNGRNAQLHDCIQQKNAKIETLQGERLTESDTVATMTDQLRILLEHGNIDAANLLFLNTIRLIQTRRDYGATVGTMDYAEQYLRDVELLERAVEGIDVDALLAEAMLEIKED